MSDLIRRADAIKSIEARIEDKYNQNDYEFGRNQAFEVAIVELEDLPTIDAVEVVHGDWEVVDQEEPKRYGCSVCKRLSFYVTNYCSCCGAKMDGERGDPCSSQDS